MIKSLKEFPDKRWSPSALDRLLQKIDSTSSFAFLVERGRNERREKGRGKGKEREKGRGGREGEG